MKSPGSRDKLILLHKPGGGGASAGSNHRLLLIIFASSFAFATFVTFLYATSHFTALSAASYSSSSPSSGLPLPVFDALVHYASFSNVSGRMSDTDIRAVSSILRRRGPCNFLVFGLSAETPLWLALNSGGRTVFLDENEFYINYLEPRHPGLEAYDVSYTTKVRDFRDLVAAAYNARATDCRPVQNLLFSECRLAINDLPNELYDVAWDVILVDGPSGYMPTSPGRMPSIFTAAVLARSGATAAKGLTDVLVHDIQYKVERECSKEFLCEENRVAGGGTPALGHYVIHGGGRRDAFCADAAAKDSAVAVAGKQEAAAAAAKPRPTKSRKRVRRTSQATSKKGE